MFRLLSVGVLSTLFVTCVAKSGATECNSSLCPEQRHLSFGQTSDVMVVMWVTPGSVTTPACNFGSQGTLQSFAKAASTRIWQINGITEFSHTCELSGLVPGQKYSYRVGDTSSGVWSDVASFTAKPDANTWSPTILVYGDLGADNDVSLPSLVQEAESGDIDFVLHVGDYAYDFDNEGGATGQRFMRDIDPVASTLPYMTCIGNHEGGTDFDHYSPLYHYMHRFQMPGKGDLVHGARGNNVYYSFDAGPAHIVAFSSEVYFWQLWDVEQQFSFIKRDLETVDRKKTPWIITMAHRPFYCSNADNDDCTKVDSNMRLGLPVLGARMFGLEELFHEHSVDLSFWAHEHSYERTWPVFNHQVMNGSTDPFVNPGAAVHVITGNAGCREDHDRFNTTFGKWSAIRSETYGYGKLRVLNASHLHWSQVDVLTRSVVDEFTIVKTDPVKKRDSSTTQSVGQYSAFVGQANQSAREATYAWSRGCSKRGVFPQDGCGSLEKATNPFEVVV